MSRDTATPATTLLDSVLDELGREIVAGILPQGHTFTLQSIGERFDISRTVAREAMRALEQLGLVTSSRRVGITVLPPSSWSVFEPLLITWRLHSTEERNRQLRSLTEMRIAVEPVAAFNAATHATEAQRIELLELAETLRELGESNRGATPEFLTADMRFHEIVLEASGNEMFQALSSPLMRALYGRTEFGLQPHVPESEALQAHEDLARSISQGDGPGAELAARTMIAEVRRALEPLEV